MSPVQDVVLAIDIGTSSTRAALFDQHGRRTLRSLAQTKYTVRYGADGTAVLSPALLRRAVEHCIRRATQGRSSGEPRHLLAVGISCFWHSLLGTDDEGRPVTPIYTWADSRSRADAAGLRAECNERLYHRRTGCMLRSHYWPAKLRWLQRTEPRLFRKVSYWLSPAEWLQWQRTGIRPSVSRSMASGTGLYDLRRDDWDTEWLERCGISRAQLSVITDEPSGQWYPGIGDGAASNLGSEATRPGLAAINFGTSAAVRCVVDGQRPSARGFRSLSARGYAPFGLFVYRVDERRLLIGGASSNAGNVHEWTRRVFRSGPPPAAEHGLLALPLLAGDRAPHWHENVGGAVTRLTLASTGPDIQQAFRDGCYQRIALIAERLEPAAGRRLRFVLSGGLAAFPEEAQRLCDVLGRPLMLSNEPEASLRGAAVYVLERLGYRVTPLPPGRKLTPDRRRAARYRIERERLAEWERELS